MRNQAKFVLSKSALKKQYDIVAAAGDVVSYSSKTNYIVAELLEEMTDCMFSIHSLTSLETVQDPSRVWYFAQAWDCEEIQTLFERGVHHFVVDNETDLALLLNSLETHEGTISLLLRMRLKEHTIHTGKYFVYGMYSHQVNRLIPALKKNQKIDSLGVHFHRKSQNISEWSLQYELADMLSEETLHAIDWLNMGGGIPVPYKNFRAQVQKHVFEEIEKLRTWLKERDIKLIIEPGRFIAAPCVKLIASIKNVYDNTVIVDASVYNTALDTFVVHHKLLIEGELEENTGEAFVVKGCTPDSMDLFRYRVWLKDPKVGDAITFLNAGAYNYTSDFCKLPRLETEVTE